MNEFGRAPFVRLLIPFLAGIAAGISYPQVFPGSFFILPVLLSAFVLICSAFRKQAGLFRLKHAFAISMFIFVAAAGFQLSVLHTEHLRKNHVASSNGVQQLARVRLVSSCIEKGKAYKAIAEVDLLMQDGAWGKVSGKALLYLKKSRKAATVRYGDRLIIRGCFAEIAKAPNPGMFDYKNYLSNRNIHVQVYLDTVQWSFLARNNGNMFVAMCSEWREKLLLLLRENKLSGKEYAVGSALLLGYEDKLDPDIMSAYSEAGVLHVLSVSGLHVAIVYAVLNALLFFMDRFRYGALLKALILLTVIWIYAALTGLSPSVLRSVAMFSFVIVAKAINRHSNIFNTLSASAFLLLCIDPYLLMDAGFQLSYLAVGGIVAIHPLIYNKWEASTWLTDQIWTLLCVSIAAQAATFPLALYYFHQFPNYFLITNLFVIPLSSLVMYSGITFFVLCLIHPLADWAAWIFHETLYMLNASVEFSASLPYASWKGIFISIPEMILLYLFVITGSLFLASHRIRHLRMFLALILVLLFVQCAVSFRQSRQQCFIVYGVPHATAIDFVDGKSSQTICDSAFLKYPAVKRFYVVPARQLFNLAGEKMHLATNGMTLYRLKDRRMLLIRGKCAAPEDIVKADYLVFSAGAQVSDEDLLQKIRYKHLILDASCSKKEIATWKRTFSRLKLDAWVVSEQGAFVDEYKLSGLF
jgi:competence protein ComEC